MNAAHWHLLVNHVPVFTIVFGTVALAWSIIRRSDEMFYAAVSLFLMSGIFGWISAQTGDAAEDIVKTLPDVTKHFIHVHEEVADWSNIWSTSLAVLALIAVAIRLKKPRFFRLATFGLVVVALIAVGVAARTAYLGGQIRHSEIRDEGSSHPVTPE